MHSETRAPLALKLSAAAGLVFLLAPIALIFLYAFSTEEKSFQWPPPGFTLKWLGVTLGRAFFGESMFSRERDASKICLVHLVERLRAKGFVLLDTQFTTEHLKRFGAVDVPRRRYEKLLAEALKGEAAF